MAAGVASDLHSYARSLRTLDQRRSCSMEPSVLVEARWEHLVPGEVWAVAGRILGVLLAAFGVTIVFEGLKVAGVIAGASSGG